MRVLYHICRIVLGIVFVYASYHKIVRPDQFAESMGNYRILPYYLVNLFAITLPYVEALFGLFLILQLATPAAALGLNVLMVVFLGALISAVLRGIDTGCGCFSATAEAISPVQILRDIIFLIMGVYVYAVALARETTRSRQRSEAS
jgi:uncharacterized membrane protein YphA (DoxX/SURF4 family)